MSTRAAQARGGSVRYRYLTPLSSEQDAISRPCASYVWVTTQEGSAAGGLLRSYVQVVT